ncbi:kinase-like domain-containing protein [Crepidotus variabilis]|uniref:Kinase-like domain-containing protein n=1 Tax=Crepidotus variabilis TaxID=179855 RepID=A0A9P6JJ33_9AGAR|nr:kinase-like domain-containing protein [Crepidotus variabilis]
MASLEASSTSSPFRSLPSPLEYLQLVECQLISLYSDDQRPFLNALAEIAEGYWSIQTILVAAHHLKQHPRLLYGLNCLLQPQCRLECSTTVDEVSHFVLVHQRRSTILSLPDVDEGLNLPTSCEDVLRLLNDYDAWDKLFKLSLHRQWLECFAQILQELIDDPAIDKLCKSAVYKRLHHLAKHGILPPSIFLHFVIIGNTKPSYVMNRTEYIASGGVCDIHKVSIRGTVTCLRVIRQTEMSDAKQIYKAFCSEIIVWRQLDHPNLAPFIGATAEIFPGRYCFALPWFKNGSIVFYLKENPEHDKFLAVQQILEAVDYLHTFDPPIVHKDIKGANILVNDEGVCLLSDFGLSGTLDLQHVSSAKGTLYWMPPELFGEDCDAHANTDGRPRDIYSLGCTIYEILTRNKPSAIMFSVLQGSPPRLPPLGKWTIEELHLWRLVADCVEIKPGQRPLIRIIKEHLSRVRNVGVSQLTVLSRPNSLKEPPSRAANESEKWAIQGWLWHRFSYQTVISDVPYLYTPPLRKSCRPLIYTDVLCMGMGWV